MAILYSEYVEYYPNAAGFQADACRRTGQTLANTYVERTTDPDTGRHRYNLRPTSDKVAGVLPATNQLTQSFGAATLVTLGNSITANSGPVSSSTLSPQVDFGWQPWAMAFLGQRLQWVYNAGIPGQTLAQIEARIATDVLPYKPTFCSVQEITNTISTGGTVADCIARIDTICATLLGAGIRPILWTATPRNSTLAANILHEQANQYVRYKAQTTPGVILVDGWRATVDPSSATAFAKTNYLQADLLHPSAKGARALGQAFANAVSPFLPAINPFFPTNVALTKANDTSLKVMNSNPLMTGTGGSLLGTGASGTVPTNYVAGTSSGTGTCVVSTSARSDGFGNDAVLTISGAASGYDAFIRPNNTESLPYYNSLDWLQAMCYVQVTGATGLAGLQLRILGQIGGTNYQNYGMKPSAVTNNNVNEYDQSDWSGWIVTPFTRLPAGSPTLLYPGLDILFGASSGAATVKVSQMVLLNFGQNLTLY